ncbi:MULTISPECIES: hypothetical protein [Pseudomonas]|jgi:hypothetical protein|uniref:Uncharacterized protein n=1 Tax=Pseudomonas putida TaxID=303 RepID=A0A9X8EFQ6_PSEPU|nr:MULTISPECIES: hypothetical protein [Pseudomonas]KTC25282.1 hypothetical protein AO392_13705 [Pseudomonas putida]MBG8561097.1 hypothetical protein [Pseudomonas qingdaonensis]MCO7505952.1 hypothetical protein [Pseudomonas sp. VE 267-6A]MCO7528286.1 hypothetical protein [Pseudomonas sp. 2]MDD1956739.1 hypothetical protein [Pseudomonas sp. 8209]
MIAKLMVTVGIVFYAVVVPILEINDTHVFNQAWEPHARLHETWQLFTNTAIGAYSVWLVWGRDNLRLASLLTLFVTGGFLMAYWLRDGYGGSMVLTDGSEKMILGVNLGLFAYALAILLAGLAVALERRRPDRSLEADQR